MRDWISMQVDSGSTNDRHALMSGSVNHIPNRTRTSNRNRSIVCTRTGKNVCIDIQEKLSTLNMEHLRPGCLQQLVVWGENASGITVD